MYKHNWFADLPVVEAQEKHTLFWDHLSEHAYPISKGSIRIPISMEPFLLHVDEHANIQKNIELILSAAKKLVEQYESDIELQNTIHLHPEERALISASRNEPLVGVVRVDVLHGEAPQMVEINADFPDGFFMHDVTARAIADGHAHTKGQVIPSHAQLHADLLESEGVAPEDHIFIGYNKGREFIDEFELTRLQLKKAGWSNVCIGPIEDLEFHDGSFFAHGEKVSVIKRGAELSKIRTTPGLLQNLLEAKNGGLKIVNNFRLRLLGHKALMAALHDTRFHTYLAPEEIAAINAFLPKTIKLDQADSNSLIDSKDVWVLKPSDLAEGNGVYVGSSLTQHEWEEALKQAAPQGHAWIIQKKVSLPKDTFNLYDEDTNSVGQAEAHYDLDPHVMLFKDKVVFGNILVRFSSSEVVNVMKGGGITYALPADPTLGK